MTPEPPPQGARERTQSAFLLETEAKACSPQRWMVWGDFIDGVLRFSKLLGEGWGLGLGKNEKGKKKVINSGIFIENILTQELIIRNK